jgi:hypothetical protein
MITPNKTSSRIIFVSPLISFYEHTPGAGRTRGGLTSNPPRKQVELGLASILNRSVLPRLNLDIQYFSIGDIGGVDRFP